MVQITYKTHIRQLQRQPQSIRVCKFISRYLWSTLNSV